MNVVDAHIGNYSSYGKVKLFVIDGDYYRTVSQRSHFILVKGSRVKYVTDCDEPFHVIISDLEIVIFLFSYNR